MIKSYVRRARCIQPVFAMLLVLLLGSAIPSYSQQIWQMLYPGNGTTSVATNASIVVRAPQPILTNSITWNYPDAEANGIVANTPTVLVLKNSFSQSTPRNNWHRKAVYGAYVLDNPRTLRYTPNFLESGTEYRCVVGEVQLLNGTIVPEREFTFSTREDVPKIIFTTFDTTSAISCKTPLILTFSTPISQPYSLYLQKLRVNYGGSDSTLPAPYTATVNAAATSITITPTTNWKIGSILSVQYTGGLITGSHLDNKQWTANIRAASKVVFHAVSTDGRAIPAEINTAVTNLNHNVLKNEGISLNCPDWFAERWKFVRWECPTLPSLSEPNNNAQTVSVACENLIKEIPITVVLEEIDTVWLALEVDSNGRVDVYSGVGAAATLLTSVTNTSTKLPIVGAGKTYSIMAVPNSGHSFQSWSATGLPAHGSTTSVQQISVAILQAIVVNGGNAIGSPFQPNFPFNPTNPGGIIPELYKLKVELVNFHNDNQDPEETAQWMSEKIYEDVTPGGRDIKVRVGKNWQIIGYKALTEGKEDMFQVPVKELRETFLLTKPENIVSIFVERIETSLRIERVVLKNDQDEQYFPFRIPASESDVIIEKGIKKGTETKWQQLTKTACMDHDLPFLATSIRLGDNIRIRIRSSNVRGSQLMRFSHIPNYVVPTQSSKVGDYESFTALIEEEHNLFSSGDCAYSTNGKEVRMRAAFREQFGIKEIGLRVRIRNGEDRSKAKFEWRWYDPMFVSDPYPEETAGSHQMEYEPFWGTPIRVRFNEAVDVQTVYNGNMSAFVFDQCLPREPLNTDLNATIPSDDDGRINGFSSNGTSIDIIEFRVANPSAGRPRPQALYDAVVDFTVSNKVKSLLGQPLLMSYDVSFNRMESPGILHTLQSIEYKYDKDADFWPFSNAAEVYNAVYGGNITDKGFEKVESTFKRIPNCEGQRAPVPDYCTLAWEDNQGAQEYINPLFVESQWMQLNDVTWEHIQTFDEDCRQNDNCLVNNIYDLLEAVKNKVSAYDAGKKTIDEVRSMVPDIVQIGAQFIQGLLPIDTQDDFLGELDLLKTHSDLWGVRVEGGPLIVKKTDNSIYKIQPQLLVSKSVYR